MIEILVTLITVGTITGFVYSMPIAGPISIVVVSKSFQGKVRFCLRTALGAAIIEFVIVFMVVYGLTKLLDLYQPIIPYFLMVGAVFVIIIGFKIRKQKVDLESLGSNNINDDKDENRGGLRTGIVLNITNPSLLINWFIASFITLSFVSSIGLNIGGLDAILNQNIESVSEITGTKLKQIESNNHEIFHESNGGYEKVTPLFMSLAFALGVGLGVYIWLLILTKLIIRYRDKVKTSILNKLISWLGIVLIVIGFVLGYRAIHIFLI